MWARALVPHFHSTCFCSGKPSLFFFKVVCELSETAHGNVCLVCCQLWVGRSLCTWGWVTGVLCAIHCPHWGLAVVSEGAVQPWDGSGSGGGKVAPHWPLSWPFFCLLCHAAIQLVPNGQTGMRPARKLESQPPGQRSGCPRTAAPFRRRRLSVRPVLQRALLLPLWTLPFRLSRLQQQKAGVASQIRAAPRIPV